MNKQIYAVVLAMLCAAGIAQASEENKYTRLTFTEDDFVDMPPLVGLPEAMEPTIEKPLVVRPASQSILSFMSAQAKKSSSKTDMHTHEADQNSLSQLIPLHQLDIPFSVCANSSQAEDEIRLLNIALKLGMNPKPELRYNASSPQEATQVQVIYPGGYQVVIPYIFLLKEQAQRILNSSSLEKKSPNSIT
jgi:hypothetical protein